MKKPSPDGSGILFCQPNFSVLEIIFWQKRYNGQRETAPKHE